jgi:hypothetical protein
MMSRSTQFGQVVTAYPQCEIPVEVYHIVKKSVKVALPFFGPGNKNACGG